MEQSTAFGKLHHNVQRWIWKQGWPGLRPVQEQAVNAIFDHERDVIISAPTAGGKTEAAFLPVYSKLLHSNISTPGFQALALSPLKALINDQSQRLEGLSDATNITITPWHGDASTSKKQAAFKNPAGILMITPESLEALFALRGNNEIYRLFNNLRFVVIDELHAFIGSERGIQMQSLLHRIEAIVGKKIRRIGLSATLGDISLAAEALRPFANEQQADCIEASSENSGKLQLQIRSYAPSRLKNSDEKVSPADERLELAGTISRHIFKVLRGSTNLIFAGSRSNVEVYTDALTQLCKRNSVPEEFLPHHGNLSKEIRHDTETKLKKASQPYSAVCTTTLELGIDIGDVESVAHIGAPLSIASLKQKLGRSGRRPGKPAILRIYSREQPLDSMTNLLDGLCLDTVMSIAAVELLLEKWCEAPKERALHLSTFTQQILSVIVSRGGISAAEIYHLLCETGPFKNIEKSDFIQLLKDLARQKKPVIEQSPDGTLMLGETGEKLVEHYTFFAIFQTPEEYRVIADNKTLGTVPVEKPLFAGATILFAGRRWDVVEIRDREKKVIVKPGIAGVPLQFGGNGGTVDKKLVQKLRFILQGDQVPSYLNDSAKKHLEQARSIYVSSGLANSNIYSEDDYVLLFPWIGTYGLVTLQLVLMKEGIGAEIEGLIAIKCKADIGQCQKAIANLANNFTYDPVDLAALTQNLYKNKYDWHLGRELLIKDYAFDQLNIEECLEGITNLA